MGVDVPELTTAVVEAVHEVQQGPRCAQLTTGRRSCVDLSTEIAEVARGTLEALAEAHAIIDLTAVQRLTDEVADGGAYTAGALFLGALTVRINLDEMRSCCPQRAKTCAAALRLARVLDATSRRLAAALERQAAPRAGEVA
jgi:hypothetical protein